MRHWLFVAAALCFAPPTLAASGLPMLGPPTTVMIGTTTDAGVNGSGGAHCGSSSGPASFQRQAVFAGAPLPSAVISLPSVYHTTPAKPGSGSGARGAAKPAIATPDHGTFVGGMVLKFTSAAAGTIAFDFRQDITFNTTLPSGYAADFTGYSQIWTPSAGTLKVSFDIVFANCTLPIVALFRAAL
jgi:hypothetical protein